MACLACVTYMAYHRWVILNCLLPVAGFDYCGAVCPETPPTPPPAVQVRGRCVCGHVCGSGGAFVPQSETGGAGGARKAGEDGRSDSYTERASMHVSMHMPIHMSMHLLMYMSFHASIPISRHQYTPPHTHTPTHPRTHTRTHTHTVHSGGFSVPGVGKSRSVSNSLPGARG